MQKRQIMWTWSNIVGRSVFLPQLLKWSFAAAPSIGSPPWPATYVLLKINVRALQFYNVQFFEEVILEEDRDGVGHIMTQENVDLTFIRGTNEKLFVISLLSVELATCSKCDVMQLICFQHAINARIC